MKALTISQARNTLPSLLDSIVALGKSVVVTRRGKALAKIVPIQKRETGGAVNRHPLRGVPITISDNFDSPMPEIWSALKT